MNELKELKPFLQKEQEAAVLLKEVNAGICHELAEGQNQLAQKAQLFGDLKEVRVHQGPFACTPMLKHPLAPCCACQPSFSAHLELLKAVAMRCCSLPFSLLACKFLHLGCCQPEGQSCLVL